MKDGDDETSSAGGGEGDASGANGVDVDDGADANDGKVNEDESLVDDDAQRDLFARPT